MAAIAELRTWEGAVLGLKSGHESHPTPPADPEAGNLVNLDVSIKIH